MPDGSRIATRRHPPLANAQVADAKIDLKALRLCLEPPAGSTATRLARLQARTPHAVRIAARFLPAIPRPSVDLPDLTLPSIPWPGITLPQWLVDARRTSTESTKYWLPVAIAIGVARRELARHRAQEQARGQDQARVQQQPGTDPDRQEDDGGPHDQSSPA